MLIPAFDITSATSPSIPGSSKVPLSQGHEVFLGIEALPEDKPPLGTRWEHRRVSSSDGLRVFVDKARGCGGSNRAVRTGEPAITELEDCHCVHWRRSIASPVTAEVPV